MVAICSKCKVDHKTTSNLNHHRRFCKGPLAVLSRAPLKPRGRVAPGKAVEKVNSYGRDAVDEQMDKGRSVCLSVIPFL